MKLSLWLDDTHRITRLALGSDDGADHVCDAHAHARETWAHLLLEFGFATSQAATQALVALRGVPGYDLEMRRLEREVHRA